LKSVRIGSYLFFFVVGVGGGGGGGGEDPHLNLLN